MATTNRPEYFNLHERDVKFYDETIEYLNKVNQQQSYVLADIADSIANHSNDCQVCRNSYLKLKALFDLNIKLAMQRKEKIMGQGN